MKCCCGKRKAIYCSPCTQEFERVAFDYKKKEIQNLKMLVKELKEQLEGKQ